MKIKFEFGNIKTKIYYDVENNKNPFEEMFAKPNIELLNKLYEKLPASIMDYYRDFNKNFEEYSKILKQKEKLRADKDSMWASGHDIYNYVARYGLANFQIQAVMNLDGILDFNKLSKAVRLSIDAQPILGCRFIENEPPYWKRITNIDKVLFCSFEYTENPDEAIQKFLDTPIDMDKDLMIKVKLVRSGANDTIVVKVNHSCADGIGTIDYIRLLSEIYSCIDQDYGFFIPKISNRSRIEQDKLFNGLGIKDPETEWIPGSEITNATWAFPWRQSQLDTFQNVVVRLPQGLLEVLKTYSKLHGATINDILLTAYFRAMSHMGEPVFDQPMEIPVTIDLRRFLPDHKTEAIRNFSGSEAARLNLNPNESFEETLLRVIPLMNHIKENRPGLQSAIGLERVERMSMSETLAYYKTISQWSYVCSDKCAPVLSNLGIIADPLLRFGKREVTDAYIVPPVVRSPGFLLMVSSYNGIITLAGGYYDGSVSKEDIEKLLGKIKDELIEGCK